MSVRLPYRVLHGLEDAQYNFEWLETHWPTSTGGGGGTGGDLSYVHTQLSAAATWNVAHNLGKYPTVAIVDSGNNMLIADIHYVDANNLTVNFAAATSGKAYAN